MRRSTLHALARFHRQLPWWTFLALTLAPGLASSAQLTLSWTDNANNESGYRIERRIGGGSYGEIAVLGPNSTNYTDTNLAESTNHCYRVRAFNAAGVSGYSNEACKVTSQSTLNLTVAKTGSGTGTVSSSPAGINCGSDCTEAFPSTTTVNLTASPVAGSRFDGWSGGGCTGTGPCTLVGNVSPTVTATFTATTSGATCPAGQYLAEYYNNVSLGGTAAFSRCEAAITNDWGSGGPGNGLGSDNFSVRWTGSFTFAGGSYVFTARADDGVRVVVDGTSVIDAWRDQPATSYQATVSLAAGTHSVKVEYYERGGSAVAQVSWAATGTTCPAGQYRAEYYNNVSLSGTAVFSRCEAAITNDWGSGGPGNGLGTDNFSVRWTGSFTFAGGSYVFTARADDGVRVVVDGTSVIDAWRDQPATSYQATVSLVAGTHSVKVEYYERGGSAVAQVSWAATSGGTASVAGAGTIIAKVTNPTGSGAALSVIRDGDTPPVGSADSRRQYDSYDGNNGATDDWMGYQFGTTQTFTKVVFQEGMHFFDGGWFNTLTVQVRRNGQWVGVSNLVVSPAYAGSNGVNFETYTLSFTPIQGDAIRLYGAPGGSAAFISVGELDVFAQVP